MAETFAGLIDVSNAASAVIGKAPTPLDEGIGLVDMTISLQ